MKETNQETRRKQIVEFFQMQSDKAKSFTVNHFQLQGLSQRMIYDVLQTYAARKTTTRKEGSGRLNWKLTNVQKAAIVRHNVDKVGVSQRKLARKYNVNQSTISRMFKDAGVKVRKRQRAPKYNDDQIVRIKKCCKILSSKFVGKTVVLDDESYFCLRSDEDPANDHFYTRCIEKTPNNVRYKTKAKFQTRLLVWLAVSSFGISKPVFVPRFSSVTGKLYRDECLKPVLIPYIRGLPNQDSVVFWPDLATAHYAKETTDMLQHQNITFVNKLENPPNLPQCRPIENFWSFLKSLVYSDGWEAKNIDQLKRRIRKVLKTIDTTSLCRDFEGMIKKLKCVAKHGPFSVL